MAATCRPLKQRDEFGDAQARLADDAAQGSALDVATAMQRHGDLAGRVGRMDEAAVTTGRSRHEKACPLEGADDFSGPERREPLVHEASVTLTSRMRGGSPAGTGSPRAAQSSSTRR